MASPERDVFTAFYNRLVALSWVKSVAYEKIRVAMDFQEHEVPAIQIYDGNQEFRHERTRLETDWQIVVELIMKQTVSGVVDQMELFDKKYDIERQLGAMVQLGLQNSGMIHLMYDNAVTDIHTFDPYYVARLTFVVKFYKPFTAEC